MKVNRFFVAVEPVLIRYVVCIPPPAPTHILSLPTSLCNNLIFAGPSAHDVLHPGHTSHFPVLIVPPNPPRDPRPMKVRGPEMGMAPWGTPLAPLGPPHGPPGIPLAPLASPWSPLVPLVASVSLGPFQAIHRKSHNSGPTKTTCFCVVLRSPELNK